jgi:hypothetical protein
VILYMEVGIWIGLGGYLIYVLRSSPTPFFGFFMSYSVVSDAASSCLVAWFISFLLSVVLAQCRLLAQY